MKHSMWKVAFLAAAVLISAVACNKKSADGASVTSGRDARVNVNGALPTGQGATGNQSAMINFTEAQKPAMRNAVQVLVAPTMPADSVGDINSIEVTGNVGFQSGGQILNDSVIQIVIRDSYADQTVDGQRIDPITIRIRGATGSIMNPQANMTFSDEYGTITVTGTWNQQTFNGSVSFQNRKAAENGDSKGTLGQFSISTCSFFRCM